MNSPFTRDERENLLSRYFPAYQRWRDLDFELSVPEGNGQDPRMQELGQLSRMLMDIRDQYRRSLPIIPVSRCPFSAQVVYHSLDPYGIDGLWWNYDAPIRPVENYPPTVHSVTGAIRLAEPVENAPFTCSPGPAVPYIVTEVLSNEHIRAVVSAIPVGRHQGYLVAYYSNVNPMPVPRINTWGTGRWEVLDTRGTLGWGSDTFTPAQSDFDLGPWIRKEKLLWIRPGDPTFTLQKGEAGCPFISLPGTRENQKIRNGRVQATKEPGGN